MSDQAGILPKWFSSQGIILAKGQLNHSYTFWTMPILMFSPVQIIMRHPLCQRYADFPLYSNKIPSQMSTWGKSRHILVNVVCEWPLVWNNEASGVVWHLFQEKNVLYMPARRILIHFIEPAYALVHLIWIWLLFHSSISTYLINVP